MTFVIRHRRSFLGWWPSYSRTTVSDEGILITRFLRSSQVIPWSAIRCLDLSGLKERDLSWMNELSGFDRFLWRAVKQSRFFLIMTEPVLVRSFRDGLSKNWVAGGNVLGLTNIVAADGKRAAAVLTDQANAHGVKLDTLVLES